MVPPSQIHIDEFSNSIEATRFRHTPSLKTLRQEHSPRQDKLRVFHFAFEESWPLDGPRHVYIPSAGGPFQLSLNGTVLPPSEPSRFFAPGFGKSWQHVALKRSQLLPGRNRIEITVPRDETRSGIREVYIGPSHRIERIAEQQKRWMNVLPEIVLFCGIVIMIISMLGLIYARGKNAYLVTGCLGCLLVMEAMFSQVQVTTSLKNFELALRLLLPFCICLLLLLLQIYDRDHWQGLEPPKIALYGFALTGPFIALALMVFPLSIPASLFLATLALLTPLPLLVLGSLLNILQDLKGHKSRLETLSETVSVQAEELDERDSLIAKAQRNQTIMEERQRFTRDIHDGIGGQLLSLLLRVRTGNIQKDEIAREIQAGLDDLRLVVDSLDHTGDNLEAALTTFRARARNQLDAANITLNWEQSDKIFIKFRTTRGTLHLFRFLQESITNVIKHSKAKNAWIKIVQADETSPLTVLVSDDGKGSTLEEVSNSSGRGMRNLKNRAEHLGAKFNINFETDGTQLELEIPPMPIAPD